MRLKKRTLILHGAAVVVDEERAALVDRLAAGTLPRLPAVFWPERPPERPT